MATSGAEATRGGCPCQGGARPARRPLSARFQELIDAVAMRAGATDADAYLDGWTHGPGSERPGTAAAVADAVAAELESGFEALAASHLRPTP